MKRTLAIIFSLIVFSGYSYGYYDFRVSPQDYEMFKEYYDSLNEFKLLPDEEDEEPVMILKDNTKRKNQNKEIKVPVEEKDGIIHIK